MSLKKRMPAFSRILAAFIVAGTCGAFAAAGEPAADPTRFNPIDVFELEWATDPQISPDGRRVVYVRNFMDVMSDRRRSNLWVVNVDGSDARPLTTGVANDRSPRWSPDGARLLYVSSDGGSSQLWLRWMDSGQTAQLTRLQQGPGSPAWSPDGKQIAFSMFVPDPEKSFAPMPPRPKGAEWAPPARVIDSLIYRSDGEGYLESGRNHLFVLPVEGGTPRQVTSGDFDHDGTPAFSPDGRSLLFSSNRHDNWEYDPNDSELHLLDLTTGAIRTLTDRHGPDGSPAFSPDGRRIAWLGFDERYQGFQVTRLYVMGADGSGRRMLAPDLDRSAGSPVWTADSSAVVFSYSDRGNTLVARASLDGGVETLAVDLGGTSLGRPYSGGSFSLARDGAVAYTHSRPDRPSDVAIGRAGKPAVRLTRLNDDLFDHKRLGRIEEIVWKSSFDGREVQGWICTPPDFDPAKRYPLILEIHGGPFANYGDRFAAEIQLFASAGYVVLYANPRGSTSYGEEFGNLIHHAYPGNDYDDLMSGVDALLARGYVDPERLYVTGGSGGGVLTAWIVGSTARFRAAVVVKPVINWYSFVLTADQYSFFYRYWFPGFPWDHLEHYMARSPISLVGNVTTPTMLMTGESDYRTPMSETEQYYQALKLRRVETALVRIPGASHGIANRPSNLIGKVSSILTWFRRYGGEDAEQAP